MKFQTVKTELCAAERVHAASAFIPSPARPWCFAHGPILSARGSDAPPESGSLLASICYSGGTVIAIFIACVQYVRVLESRDGVE